MQFNRNFAALMASTLLLSGIATASYSETKAGQPPAATQNLPAIRVTEVKTRTLTDRVIVTGTIDAVQDVYVQPQVDGVRLESLKADIGDEVKVGDTLATLSQDSFLLQKQQYIANMAKSEAVGAQYEAQLAEAQANAEESQRQADRAEKLIKTNAVSVTQLEQYRATAKANDAKVRSARQAIVANKADIDVVKSQIADVDLSLSRTSVKAPVNGLITVRNAKIGEIASASANPMFTIIRDNEVELKGDVAEGDVLRLKPGQSVNVALAGTATRVAGAVRMIDPIIDETTRLGAVKITVKNSSLARVGMFASAEIIVSARKVLSLPLTAVTAEKDGDYVRKVQDGVIKMTKVTTGVADGDFVEIAAGLNEKDVVVAKAGVFVRDGDHISPVLEQQASTN